MAFKAPTSGQVGILAWVLVSLGDVGVDLQHLDDRPRVALVVLLDDGR